MELPAPENLSVRGMRIRENLQRIKASQAQRYNRLDRAWPECHELQRRPLRSRAYSTRALAALVEQVKRDRSILAAILCGSLSHDTVWAKSDIDLVLVTIDDKKADKDSLCLYADGVNVHAILMPRAEFRKTVEGSIRNSFMHSLLAKGRLLYTHDETIADSLRRDCTRSASATPSCSCSPRRCTRCPPSTRPTSGSSRAAIWTTRRSGFSTRRTRWRRSR